jgi:predicted dehydrogenase
MKSIVCSLGKESAPDVESMPENVDHGQNPLCGSESGYTAAANSGPAQLAGGTSSLLGASTLLTVTSTILSQVCTFFFAMHDVGRMMATVTVMRRSRSRVAKLVVAEETIGVGIVGLSAAGGWGHLAHAPAIEAVDGYELRALSASSQESAVRSGEMHGVRSTFTSAAELAACDEVDLVVVAVKVPEHAELVTAALDAGKAVLCEWPLGNGLAEAERLAELAREREIPTAIGLQARSQPALAYLRDLIQNGYVGEVLSTSVLGFSGGAWGPTVFPGGHYALDATNGATLRSIPFGHTVDGLAWVLGEPEQLRVEEVRRRSMALDPANDEILPMTSPDQVSATGTLPGGAVVTVHFRGGSSRGENFRWEINGTEGDILVTAPHGNIQLAPLTIFGGRGSDTELSELPVPDTYDLVPTLDPVADAPAYVVADAYRRFRDDLRHGTATVPDFAHAVVRHRSIEPVADTLGRAAQTPDK